MALTLLEASKLNKGEFVRSAVIEMFAENADLLRVMPFEDIPGGAYSYSKEGSLPGVAFRGFNESYTESTGVINPETEVLRIIGGDIDVDKALIKTRGAGIRTTHEAMKIKRIALDVMAKMITGDSEVDPREYDGLRKRINGNQLIPANLTAPTANSPLSLEALDSAIDEVDGANYLLMSKAMRNKLSVAARSTTVGGDLQWDKDDFGRRVAMYNDIPILIADYDGGGQRIIDFNEAGPAGGTTSTSIYVLNIGEGMVQGIQNGVMDVEDLGEIDEKPVLRTRIEWIVGMAILHGRAASRVWGITNADVTK